MKSTYLLTGVNITQLLNYFELEKQYNKTAKELTNTFDALQHRLELINNGNKRIKINGICDFYPITEFDITNKTFLDTTKQVRIISDLGLDNTQWYVIEDSDYSGYNDNIKYYVCNHLLDNDDYLDAFINMLKDGYANSIKSFKVTQEKEMRRAELEKLKELQEKYGDVSKYYDNNGNYISENTQSFTMPIFKGNIDDLQKVSY